MRNLRAQQEREMSILKSIPCHYYFDEETCGGVIRAIRRDARNGESFDEYIQPSYKWYNNDNYKRFRRCVRNRLHKMVLSRLINE